MYTPEISIRLEVAQTDAPHLREWRMVLGGAVRGGVSSAHGYLPTSGPILGEEIDNIYKAFKQLLEAYVSGLGGWQLQLDCE